MSQRRSCQLCGGSPRSGGRVQVQAAVVAPRQADVALTPTRALGGMHGPNPVREGGRRVRCLLGRLGGL
eukprot:CAMPEP_0113945924 /NCGR_PEP_ID=MMETSP1339-20121228/53045_1 /TAXON_ID=94617 /ORGANISM="Fibrocapsa japonica" /LENGTH=68 /DNA_ID=CAMNT_0000951767 /DNA_START=50 /DNA_END=252 /DNA_ORIENTATION=- /assembly_acc=CAM_ASM_000762